MSACSVSGEAGSGVRVEHVDGRREVVGCGERERGQALEAALGEARERTGGSDLDQPTMRSR
jgi:hypothetical protein